MNSILESIEEKLKIFIALYDKMNDEKNQLTEINQQLTNQISLQKKELNKLEEKIRILNISKTIESSGQELKDTRQKINDYVREIDKCIALLNK